MTGRTAFEALTEMQSRHKARMHIWTMWVLAHDFNALNDPQGFRRVGDRKRWAGLAVDRIAAAVAHSYETKVVNDG